MTTEQDRRRELEMMTEAKLHEVYALTKRSGSGNEFVGNRTSETKKKMIDYIIAAEKSAGKISD